MEEDRSLGHLVLEASMKSLPFFFPPYYEHACICEKNYARVGGKIASVTANGLEAEAMRRFYYAYD